MWSINRIKPKKYREWKIYKSQIGKVQTGDIFPQSDPNNKRCFDIRPFFFLIHLPDCSCIVGCYQTCYFSHFTNVRNVITLGRLQAFLWESFEKVKKKKFNSDSTRYFFERASALLTFVETPVVYIFRDFKTASWNLICCTSVASNEPPRDLIFSFENIITQTYVL